MKTFLQRRYPDGQRAHENMLNAANYWRNANHKYNEFSPHTGQKDQHQNITLQTINAGEGVEKRNPSTQLMGMQIGTATVENSMEISHKTKNRTTI